MPKTRNLIGQRFGRLVVVEKTNLRQHRSIVWKCQCDCGNEHYTYTNILTSGQCQSCGCLQKELNSQRMTKTHNELIGQRFGKLTVIEKTKDHKAANGSYMMKCLCDCGATYYASPAALTSGHVHSCGCLHQSLGEMKISQILTENNIPFEAEKRFETCVNPHTGRQLRFDFYVNNTYIIEYDGHQHFDATGGWGKSLQEIQERDEQKTQWCKNNNIPLLRIPYLKYDSLTIDDLLLPEHLLLNKE